MGIIELVPGARRAGLDERRHSLDRVLLNLSAAEEAHRLLGEALAAMMAAANRIEEGTRHLARVDQGLLRAVDARLGEEIDVLHRLHERLVNLRLESAGGAIRQDAIPVARAEPAKPRGFDPAGATPLKGAN